MKLASVILIILVGSVVSCHKFEHELFEIPNCELCQYAETLEGTYRGMSGGVAVPNYGDSVTITVDQIFLGNSQYEDSTFIRLEVNYDFDSSTVVKTHIIRLLNDNGHCKAYMEGVFGPSGSNVFSHPQGYYTFTTDSLKVSYSNTSGISQTVPYFGGNFAKQ
jgi:hypothetical protein